MSVVTIISQIILASITLLIAWHVNRTVKQMKAIEDMKQYVEQLALEIEANLSIQIENFEKGMASHMDRMQAAADKREKEMGPLRAEVEAELAKVRAKREELGL